jgi:hypothetical protein
MKLIDASTDYLYITMTEGIDLTTLSASSDSLVVGSSSTHTLKFTCPVTI